MAAKESKIFETTPEGQSLAWLADAPLFIDAVQIGALYNAVAKPEHETEKITLNLKKAHETTVGLKGTAEAEVSIGAWLKTIFPFLDAKAKVGVEGSAEHKIASEKEHEIELRPVNTQQRQLVQLALHYTL